MFEFWNGLASVVNQLTVAQWASLAEWLGAAAGVVYVLGAAQELTWCWWASLLSTSLYAFVFGHAGLWGQAGLQLYYVPASLYGYFVWRGKTDPVVIAWLPRRHALSWAAAGVVLSVAVWWGLGAFGIDESILDVLTTVGSLIATYLMSIKKIDSWVFWIVIDATIAALCVQQHLWVTSLLYGSFIGLAVFGFRQWQRSVVEPSGEG